MRHREPADQLLCRFVGGPAVKRHHRRRTAGDARNLSPPLIEANTGHLDAVVAAIDRFLEPMHRHVASSCAGS